jgi:hypothetical protein
MMFDAASKAAGTLTEQVITQLKKFNVKHKQARSPTYHQYT